MTFDRDVILLDDLSSSIKNPKSRLYEFNIGYIEVYEPKEIEKYFYDHKVITSLGCESILNQVVIFNDETIGTINILNKKNYFTKKHLEKSNIISKCLVSTFINKRKDITYGR